MKKTLTFLSVVWLAALLALAPFAASAAPGGSVSAPAARPTPTFNASAARPSTPSMSAPAPAVKAAPQLSRPLTMWKPGPAAAAPRAMPSFNMGALRQPAQPIPAPTVKAAPQLSRPFYKARDGNPANGGFAAGAGRITTLKPGAFIGRKGGDGTWATTTLAPKPGALGLEPKADRQPMQYWRVRRPLDVVSGTAGPAWGAQGGANQVVLPGRTNSLSSNGYLTRSIAPNFSGATRRR